MQLETQKNEDSYLSTPFVNILLPYVKSFAYTWFHLQAMKRRYYKRHNKKISFSEEKAAKESFQATSSKLKKKWAVRLLSKLQKDVQADYKDEFIRCISIRAAPCLCVKSQPDKQGKMRRIDCLMQADKIWRLDLVMVILFRAIPLENTDGERVDRLPTCQDPLCINPYHVLIMCRELDLYMSFHIQISEFGKNSLEDDIVITSVHSIEELTNKDDSGDGEVASGGMQSGNDSRICSQQQSVEKDVNIQLQLLQQTTQQFQTPIPNESKSSTLINSEALSKQQDHPQTSLFQLSQQNLQEFHALQQQTSPSENGFQDLNPNKSLLVLYTNSSSISNNVLYYAPTSPLSQLNFPPQSFTLPSLASTSSSLILSPSCLYSAPPSSSSSTGSLVLVQPSSTSPLSSSTLSTPEKRMLPRVPSLALPDHRQVSLSSGVLPDFPFSSHLLSSLSSPDSQLTSSQPSVQMHKALSADTISSASSTAGKRRVHKLEETEDSSPRPKRLKSLKSATFEVSCSNYTTFTPGITQINAENVVGSPNFLRSDRLEGFRLVQSSAAIKDRSPHLSQSALSNCLSASIDQAHRQSDYPLADDSVLQRLSTCKALRTYVGIKTNKVKVSSNHPDPDVLIDQKAGTDSPPSECSSPTKLPKFFARSNFPTSWHVPRPVAVFGLEGVRPVKVAKNDLTDPDKTSVALPPAAHDSDICLSTLTNVNGHDNDSNGEDGKIMKERDEEEEEDGDNKNDDGSLKSIVDHRTHRNIQFSPFGLVPVSGVGSKQVVLGYHNNLDGNNSTSPILCCLNAGGVLSPTPPFILATSPGITPKTTPRSTPIPPRWCTPFFLDMENDSYAAIMVIDETLLDRRPLSVSTPHPLPGHVIDVITTSQQLNDEVSQMIDDGIKQIVPGEKEDLKLS